MFVVCQGTPGYKAHIILLSLVQLDIQVRDSNFTSQLRHARRIKEIWEAEKAFLTQGNVEWVVK